MANSQIKQVRNLPVKLTEGEWIERVGRRRGLERQRDEIEGKLDREKKATYRELQELEKEIDALGPVLDTKTEIREVEVREVKDLERRVLEVIRLDTNEVIDSRQLTIEETQADLPFHRVQGEHSVTHQARDVIPIGEARESPKTRGRKRAKGGTEETVDETLAEAPPAPATREVIDAPPLEG